ncbi:HNH endonuclease signature motif containing protein [Geobacter sp.]|uniref:HNH endonuclease signature motif containing protein n=1 Tax=Geobacter sp. TaxID=46610 RepID=UPI0027B9FF3A|nr:HNH endonuclease signature motif containing protein [Geobacter sp.]
MTTLNPLRKYCDKKCQGLAERNPRNYEPKRKRLPRQGPSSFEQIWDSARRRNYDGYITLIVKTPDGKRVQRREHRVIWERAIGIELPEHWIIHHRNGQRSDNRLENLLPMPVGDHVSFHLDISKLVGLSRRSYKKEAQLILERCLSRIIKHYPDAARFYDPISSN